MAVVPHTDARPRLRLFGVPELHAAAVHPFAPERRWQLLALLALRSGEWVPRDQVAALFWPERPNAEARRNLRKVVFNAHALPGTAGIEASDHALRWSVATDLLDFRLAVTAGRLDAAMALRGGPLLDGLDDAGNRAWTDWLEAERERWHQAWHQAAIGALRQAGTAPARLAAAEALLRVDSLDEAALAALLDAHLALGHAAEASRAYAAYAARLAETLGVEPAHGLRDRLAAAHPVAPPLQAPRVQDEFIGRRSELAEIGALLARPDCRLLTVLGPGGVGKSSLARQALERSAAAFAGGTLWLELQDLADTAALLARLAQQSGVGIDDQREPLESLARAFSAGPRRLLVLDNAEHLDGLPALLDRLLDAAAPLTLLLTSRSRTHSAHEWLLPLGGLAVPDDDSRDPEAAPSFDALRLFAARAGAAQRGFRLEAHLDAAIGVCTAVDGLPLAIELAASWVRLLPPEEIARELAGSLDLLERDPAQRGEPARPEHRSMRTVLDRSWQLLAPREREALAALSVFQGGHTRQAAQRVAGIALPVLSSLADKSLLAVDADGRFGMHPLVAAYATQRLEEDPERLAAVRGRHAEFFALHLAELAPHTIGDPRRLAEGVTAEYANCRVAWQWAVETRRADLVYAMVRALWTFFEHRGRYVEGVALLSPALALPTQLPASARALTRLRHGLSMLQHRRGDQDSALALARSGIGPGEHCGDTEAYVGCLLNTAMVLWASGRLEAALPYYEQGLRVARERGDPHCSAWALGNLGVCLLSMGRLADAEPMLREALAGLRELGDVYAAGVNMNNLGRAHTEAGRWAEAQALFEEGGRLADEFGIVSAGYYTESNLAKLLFRSGQVARARQQFEATQHKYRHSGLQPVNWANELFLVRLDLAESLPADALCRLQRVAREVRRHRAASGEVEAVALFGDWLVAQGELRRGAQAWRSALAAQRLDDQPQQRLAARLAALGDAADAGEPPRDIPFWLDALEAAGARPDAGKR